MTPLLGTPRTPASHSPRYKSLPLRFKGGSDLIFRASVLPKSKTSFSNDLTPTKILSQICANPNPDFKDLTKSCTVFNEENPLIPTLKKFIFRVSQDIEIRKLSLFFAHYLKVCKIGEILKYHDEIKSINEKCHSKMEHVPFETRLKIRFRDFYANELIRLFKESFERNLVIYDKFCLAYQWFTEFQFIAHALKGQMHLISPINYPYVLKFLVKIAINSEVTDKTFKQYFDPILNICKLSKLPELENEAAIYISFFDQYTLQDLRKKNLPREWLRFFELIPISDNQKETFVTWEQYLRSNSIPIKKFPADTPLAWKNILKKARKVCDPIMAQKVAQDLRTLSIMSIKNVTLSNFCHSQRGQNWLAKLVRHWNAATMLAKKTIETAKKRHQKRVAEFMVELAYRSYEVYDFQSSSALTAGIQSCNHLPQLSQDAKHKHDLLIEKFSPVRDFKNIKDEIKELEKRNIPYIPYLALTSKAIALIDNGNPDYIGHTINEEKLKLITKIFEKFTHIQNSFFEKEPLLTDILFELKDKEEA